MAYDKSLKILNYIDTNIDNYINLYTELDHSFNIGDKVYIVGGEYDTVDITQQPGFNPFTDLYYYTIIDVNYTQNKFTIDRIETVTPISPPYTEYNNTSGAYNSYDNDKVYRNVFVSKVIFSDGIFNSGVINNGVFGTDNSVVKLSCDISNVDNVQPNNVNIKHIVSKNTELTKGIITSKSSNTNINTKKFQIINGVHTQVSIGVNNDGYGYTFLEGLKTIQDSNNIKDLVSIRDTEITNNLKDGIVLDNVSYYNCKIASLLLSDTNKIIFKNRHTISNSVVQNINNNQTDPDLFFDIKDSTLNSGQNITVEALEIVSANNDFTIVIHDIFKGKEKLKINDEYYISNIKNNVSDYNTISKTHFKLIAVIDNGNGTLTLKCELSLGMFSGSETDSDYNFNQVKLHNINKFSSEIVNSTINDYVLESINNNINIENTTIKGGSYTKIMSYGNTVDGINNKVILDSIYQILPADNNNNDTNMSINNAYVFGSGEMISAKDIKNTRFSNIVLFQSSLLSKVIIDPDCKLNFIEVLADDYIQIDESITHYDNMKYNIKLGPLSNSTYPEGRKSPFVIGKTSQFLPLSTNIYAENYNNARIFYISFIMKSQNIIEKKINNSYTSVYEIPNLIEIPDILLYDDTKVSYSIRIRDYLFTQNLDNKRKYFDWFKQKTINKTRTDATVHPTPPYDLKFGGVNREDLTDIDNQPLYGIPTDYLDSIDKYNYKEKTRASNYEQIVFFDQDYQLEKFPDYSYYSQNINNLNDMFKVDIYNTTNPGDITQIRTVGYGETTVDNPWSHNIMTLALKFKIDSDFLDSNGDVAEYIPNSFIEIEYIASDFVYCA